MWAAERGHVGTSKLLIKHGIDVNAQTNDGESALHKAAQEGNHRVVSVLLERRSGFRAEI